MKSRGNIWWSTDPKPFSLQKIYGGNWRSKPPVCKMITHAEWKQRTAEVNSRLVDPMLRDPANYDYRLKPGGPADQLDLPSYAMTSDKKAELQAFISAPWRTVDKRSDVSDVVVTDK